MFLAILALFSLYGSILTIKRNTSRNDYWALYSLRTISTNKLLFSYTCLDLNPCLHEQFNMFGSIQGQEQPQIRPRFRIYHSKPAKAFIWKTLA
jgi:hypothetical protein